MASKSKIAWTESTWNPVVGCTKVSAGCKNCYAEKMAWRLRGMRVHPYFPPFKESEVVDKKGWTGEIHLCHGKIAGPLCKPLHWRNPRRIFVNSMSDTFHPKVPFEYIDKIMAVGALCPQHTLQILTKRADRMAEYYKAVLTEQVYCENSKNIGFTQTRIRHEALKIVHKSQQGGRSYNMWNGIYPLSNVHLGVTIENQKEAWRAGVLQDIPATVRFISFEPLISDITYLPMNMKKLHWAIIGCESGPKRRECKLEWVRRLVKTFKPYKIPIFIKQLEINGKVEHDMSKFPADLQIQKEIK